MATANVVCSLAHTPHRWLSGPRARKLGRLSPADQRAELVRMIGDLLAGRSVGVARVELICSLNKDHQLDQDRHRLALSPSQADNVTHAAALACLGSTENRARVLQALTGPDDAEVRIAEVYLGTDRSRTFAEFHLVLISKHFRDGL